MIKIPNRFCKLWSMLFKMQSICSKTLFPHHFFLFVCKHEIMLYIVSLDINNNSESDFKLEEFKEKIDDMAT